MAVPAADVKAAQALPIDAIAGRAKRRRFRFLTSGKTATGLAVIVFFLVIAVIGEWIAPYDPSARSSDLLESPSARHWFGTTHLGQDIFSQVLVGTRSVMLVGLAAGIVATILAVIVGVTSGYLGGTPGEGLSALSNVFLVIPALPLIIIIGSAVPTGGDILVAVIIGFTSWAWGARVLRAQTLSLRGREYVEAARATGESTWRIIFFEILPNLTAVIASSFVGTVIFAVMSEITLAFVGVSGLSNWNWGTILFWAQSQQALAQGAWWWFVPAGLAIAILGTALSLLNFGIDEFVSPRLRGSGKARVKGADGRTHRMRVGFTPVLGREERP
ncbi:dipeptide/oligopeptide/nickel ABC transporter permease [Amycolatopsis mediterranei S699]|uniref:Permease component of ABC-type dipeptide/oligopeptide/nickel transport system n=2 Tax=Amycolatopsis mediterranei TaxID=33910 RepID=A0A0H3DIP1_AMYMU|nr:ABC transporter permease [Amycolatopsis mediterranei]ADJ50067.1 permease component of ABC-type dipeptide/oligopeptide/nickel transport system [Amycolatopsis mediterranei U32]AEK47064.1 dipeptide/oligopeptide/nickel ABC transporter permease [Amycolatopsis mediterranei S699]AFO81775.1 dipeptide/oligopeptide/nickel ABC transporter permease [Amycolatopsis mediterranei S699]AGT88904.1 dipeptide/oligopeptide/nickel ABC transporter permease [Amycolatopsis mediterranei RB]KDO07684.1 peptide ABC tra